jgi:hypothetical protein
VRSRCCDWLSAQSRSVGNGARLCLRDQPQCSQSRRIRFLQSPNKPRKALRNCFPRASIAFLSVSKCSRRCDWLSAQSRSRGNGARLCRRPAAAMFPTWTHEISPKPEQTTEGIAKLFPQCVACILERFEMFTLLRLAFSTVALRRKRSAAVSPRPPQQDQRVRT